FDRAGGLARPDNVTGVTLGSELERIGFAGPEPVGGRPLAAYFEAHIEQGPILEAAGLPIGVVTGAQGQRWYEITVTGQEAHAGPTPTPFDPDLVAAVRDAAEAQAYRHQDIISGAGHDAVYLARIAPTAMIFVPCIGGISHNEIEDAKPDDLTAGCNVLLNAVLDRAATASTEEDRAAVSL